MHSGHHEPMGRWQRHGTSVQMNLALGTAQFGQAYGIGAANGPLSSEALRASFELAAQNAIKRLDTAPLYGDIEARLTDLTANLSFRITSKIPPLPPGLDSAATVLWALAAARKSHQRLGAKLSGLIFHRSDDLLEPRGLAAFEAVRNYCDQHAIATGLSGYSAQAIAPLVAQHQFAIVQLPGNVFDQRFMALVPFLAPGAELQLRSPFLQGLLLQPEERAAQLLAAGEPQVRAWHRWLAEQSLSPLSGALSVVKGFACASTMVFGVDNPIQLAALLDCWRSAHPIEAPELATEDLQLIDPRTWPRRRP